MPRSDDSESYGFVLFSRKTFRPDDPFWGLKRVFSYFEAWADLIALAAWSPRSVVVGSQAVELQRGQLLTSERFLASRWGWSTTKVRRYLCLCVDMGRVEVGKKREIKHGGTIISLTNYETYQDNGAAKEAGEEAQENRGLRQHDSKSKREKKRDDHGATYSCAETYEDCEAAEKAPEKAGAKRERSASEAKRNQVKQIEVVPISRAREADTGSPPVLRFPCVGSGASGWSLTVEQVERWREAYPAVDIVAEARRALAWVEANPSRRKTAGGMQRFLNNWLSRSQDRGGTATRSAGVGNNGSAASPSFVAARPTRPVAGFTDEFLAQAIQDQIELDKLST